MMFPINMKLNVRRMSGINQLAAFWIMPLLWAFGNTGMANFLINIFTNYEKKVFIING